MNALESFSLSSTDQPAPPIKVLLIDDQAIIGDCMRRLLASEKDIVFEFCSDSRMALSETERISPTVILLDLFMPDIDGLTLIRAFRKNPKTQNIPIIVCSSSEEADMKYHAFALGVNDYIVKVPDKLELVARIRSHALAYQNRLERDRVFEALVASQNALKAELDEAERYVKYLLPEKVDTPLLRTDWFFQSSTSLGGDAFGYHWLDDTHFAIYLLDVCGHGVGAALLSVSVINVLRSRSLVGVDFTDPSQVLSELNNTFDMERQNQMYFTIWYGIWDCATRQLTYASGGHPPALLVPTGDTPRTLKTGGAIIGGLPEMTFPKESIFIPQECYLYIFSDGTYEIEQKDTLEMMPLQLFLDQLAVPSDSSQNKIANVVAFCQTYQGRPHFKDDFSLLEILFH